MYSITALDRERGKLTDGYWKLQKEAAAQKTVLLVEGDDDRDIVEALLKRRRPAFHTRVRVIAAGGRDAVIRRMAPEDVFPEAYGLVDRDTWSDDEIRELQSKRPRLYVTEGWCLENAFFDSETITELKHEREPWVAAGALWWTLQRAREAAQEWQSHVGWTYGKPLDKLDLTSEATLRASLEAAVPAEVRDGSSFDPARVAERFAARRAEMQKLSEPEQWRLGVHGKRAFKDLLVPALGGTPESARWSLAESLPTPAPLDEMFAILLP